MQLKYAIIAVFVLFSVKGMAQTDPAFSYQKPLFDFDYSKPVFKLQNEQVSNKNRSLCFSVLSGYREGVHQIVDQNAYGLSFYSRRNDVAGTQHVSFYNTAIVDILGHGMMPHNMIYLGVKDPSKYMYDPKYGDKQSWMRKNAKCFELMLPIGAIKSTKLLDDFLSQEFGVTFGMGKRMVKTLVLVRTSAIDKLKSAGKGEVNYLNGHFNNIPIGYLSDPITKAGLPQMVNETGYTDPVDMELKIGSWTDLAALRKDLQRYDLDLKEEMREMEVFVITELNQEKK